MATPAPTTMAIAPAPTTAAPAPAPQPQQQKQRQRQRDVEDEEVMTEAESDVTMQNERYSYSELKEAQRRCGEKAVAAALRECGNSSTAQQKVFQAHVNDLCASIFIAVVRQYDPETKEDVEPVDKETVAKVAALEKKLREKEAALKELRETVPKLAAEKTRVQLEKSRKRSADVELTVPELLSDLSLSLNELEHLKETCEKTSSSIFSANIKLSEVINQTTETVKVVERAMKRPKTAIDVAMEQSPVKTRFLVSELEKPDVIVAAATALQAPAPTLRSKLALHLSAAKNV